MLILFPGECLVFDNQRMLHNRKGFSISKGGVRHIQGGYVDWDEIRSTINVTRDKIEEKKKSIYCEHEKLF